MIIKKRNVIMRPWNHILLLLYLLFKVYTWFYSSVTLIWRTKLFLSLESSSLTADVQKVRVLLTRSESLHAENELILNADKSDAMLIGTSAQLRAANSWLIDWLVGVLRHVNTR